MKCVILGLVLTNVAFFGWRLSQDQEMVVTDSAPPAAGVAMVNRLLLVSEVEPGVLRRRRELPSQQAAQPPASPPQPQSSEQLAGTREESASVPLARVLALPPVADRECYTLGPLENEDDISALGAWFNAQGSQATLRSDERREVTSTWVFLPPLASREAADARLEKSGDANPNVRLVRILTTIVNELISDLIETTAANPEASGVCCIAEVRASAQSPLFLPPALEK